MKGWMNQDSVDLQSKGIISTFLGQAVINLMHHKVLSSIEPSSKEVGLDLKSLWTLCCW
jgi:hypothetical protein